MSKKDALKYLKRLEKEPKLQAEFVKLKNTEDFEKMQKKHHLNFTKKEFREVYKEKHHEELTYENLSKIVAAGGGGTPILQCHALSD